MSLGDFTKEIAGHTLEYFDDEHLYLVDGLEVPSVTQILKIKFGNKYAGVSSAVLKKAAEAGTAVHDAIYNLCTTGEYANLPEVRNFIFLRTQYKFEVIDNETPVILFFNDEPIAAGRLDMVLMNEDGELGGADIKRTSVLDKNYLAYQLNIYRIAYRQCYGLEWEFLKALHLREDVRKYVDIPIDENLAWQLIHEWRQSNESD